MNPYEELSKIDPSGKAIVSMRVADLVVLLGFVPDGEYRDIRIKEAVAQLNEATKEKDTTPEA